MPWRQVKAMGWREGQDDLSSKESLFCCCLMSLLALSTFSKVVDGREMELAGNAEGFRHELGDAGSESCLYVHLDGLWHA